MAENTTGESNVKPPTMEDLLNPNYVMPLEYGAPQDRGEPAPKANPAPGPDSVTEPATETKEFNDTAQVHPSEWMKEQKDSGEFAGTTVANEPVRREDPAPGTPVAPGNKTKK